MAQDIMGQFYAAHNLPLHEKLMELTRIIDQSIPNKDLQVLFPQLISYIFTSVNNGWSLRTITYDVNRYEFELLMSFLDPQGPMFRLCYKLLSDPQLKYNLPLNMLPLDLQMTIERGRCPQFYADMLSMDSQSLNVVALALNPFDYYIFHFALHLINNNQCKNLWENWNSVYFALACDYLMHFLPCDPNKPVLPHIPNYTGKVLMAAPLQTANRPLHFPSLLRLQDLSGISNQPTSTQTQSRNEVWRSETVLQVFIDIWMNVEQFNSRNNDQYSYPSTTLRPYPATCSSPERVRTIRILVKHIHTFSAKHLSDPASRSSALRKYARQIMCARAYIYVNHLVTTWPLDASFRLVMELWLSLIQPWRYNERTTHHERYLGGNNDQEEISAGTFDPSFIQFVAENFPTYTCIFQLVLSRFMRLDLTTLKNAIMLFRLGKVFSQPYLVTILRELEQAVTENESGLYLSTESSYNHSAFDENYAHSGTGSHRWVAVAKQAISGLNLSTNFEYESVWGEKRREFSLQFVKKIVSAKLAADNIAQELNNKLNHRQRGIWSSIKRWFMFGTNYEDEMLLEESKKVPKYLYTTLQYFANIFGLNENVLYEMEPIEDTTFEHSSTVNSSSFPISITNKLRTTSMNIHYMGDPDLMPITSYESTILVRMLYQVASRLNELYGEQFSRLWHRDDFLGYLSREVLQTPRTTHKYVKDSSNHQEIVSEELPARLSLRRFGSHVFVAWLSIGYMIFKFYSCSGFFYIFTLFILWVTFIMIRATLKMLRIMKA